MNSLFKIILLFVILVASVISCKNSPLGTQRKTRKADTAYYIIPVAKIIFPFDSIYRFDSDDEMKDFLLFQIALENKCREVGGLVIDKYTKCPTLTEKNRYSNHILFEDYLTHIICFANEENEAQYCEKVITELYHLMRKMSSAYIYQAKAYPLFGRNENTKIKGYILPQKAYPKYADKFDYNFFLDRLCYDRLDHSKASVDSLTYLEEKILLLGLSKNLENNPDVLKVVSFSTDEKEK